jgi:hypothetical protein
MVGEYYLLSIMSRGAGQEPVAVLSHVSEGRGSVPGGPDIQIIDQGNVRLVRNNAVVAARGVAGGLLIKNHALAARAEQAIAARGKAAVKQRRRTTPEEWATEWRTLDMG